MVYVAYLKFKMSIHPACKAQIVLLLVKKVSISKEYIDFLDIFFKKFTVVLSNHLDINQHAIDLKSDKQLLYRLMYSLGLIELEILKTYIKINLANNFI